MRYINSLLLLGSVTSSAWHHFGRKSFLTKTIDYTATVTKPRWPAASVSFAWAS